MQELDAVGAKDSQAELGLDVSILHDASLNLLKLPLNGLSVTILLRQNVIHVVPLTLFDRRCQSGYLLSIRGLLKIVGG